ncbi:hypothetical protein BaRGS_00014832, partial [Batillaria attramentaria]
MAERKEREFPQSRVRSRGYGHPVSESNTDTSGLLHWVFLEDSSEESRQEPSGAQARGAEKALDLHNLSSFLESKLEDCVAESAGSSSLPMADPTNAGRIGPPEAILDILSNVGTLTVEPDRLGVASISNFSTIRANCCVFKGKWVYEVMLGSKGVMQLGWCTLSCRFSQEEGVGDTPDSYAYDGSRLRKWNVRTYKYGEAWLTGDVITCAIDLDEGGVEFFRNGHSMGVAFHGVKTGPGYAYFPAVSLSMVPGYKPLQEPKVVEVKQAQVLLQYLEKLVSLMVDDDRGKTSRDCFLEKFRTLLKEISGITWVFHSHTCPLPVLLCFFHRLLRAVRYYWDSFQPEDPGRFVLSNDAFLPIHMFWSDSRDASEYQRCGGLMSHLNRTLGSEVNRAQGLELKDDGKVVRADKKTTRDPGNGDYPCREMPSGNTLMELLDGLVVLYHSAAHKQLGKMWALQDNMRDFVLALQDTQKKLQNCPAELVAVKDDLSKAAKVFTNKVTELSRHMAWVIAVVYSQSKQRDVEWLLRVVLRTLEKASAYRQLFQYVPEFYIETCIHAFNALRNYFHPTQPFSSLPNADLLLQKYATFLVDHFADPRIVSNDLRDSIVQALALFTCHRDTLTVLENLPMSKRLSMIESLLAPYENRSWAHTNWILVRLWKGCGFANRFCHLPNLIPAKVLPTDFTFVSVQEPCPSQVFQSLLAKTLLDQEALSTRFLDTLMNQLNWSFSEFVGMMQE